MLECGSIQSCQLYLKNNPSITNLTITDIIESKQIVLSNGDNYITSDKLNITSVRKGYVPIIRYVSTATLALKEKNDIYPDYVCFNISTSTGELLGWNNTTNLTKYLGSVRSNVAVQFVFDSTVFVNLTLSYAYLSFGSFQPYLITKYGGNVYDTQNNKMIIIRNIQQYPFQSKI
jgi:hypothetical protein